jgi:hypothetical protein
MFLVSREFRKLATEVFYGKNTFRVTMGGQLSHLRIVAPVPRDLSAEHQHGMMEASIVHIVTCFPRGSIRFLTSLRLNFEGLCLESLQPDRDGWPHWLGTIKLLSREANLSVLALEIQLAEKFYPCPWTRDPFTDRGQPPDLDSEYEIFMLQTYERLIQPMKSLIGLKNLFIHLNWQTSFGLQDHRLGPEERLERMVMGEEYDAGRCGKHSREIYRPDDFF